MAPSTISSILDIPSPQSRLAIVRRYRSALDDYLPDAEIEDVVGGPVLSSAGVTDVIPLHQISNCTSAPPLRWIAIRVDCPPPEPHRSLHDCMRLPQPSDIQMSGGS